MLEVVLEMYQGHLQGIGQGSALLGQEGASQPLVGIAYRRAPNSVEVDNGETRSCVSCAGCPGRRSLGPDFTVPSGSSVPSALAPDGWAPLTYGLGSTSSVYFFRKCVR